MASLAGEFNLQEFTDAGAPLAGGRLYTYINGTTTQKTAYTDIAEAVPHTYTSDGAGGQYIALNARGELPAPLYLKTGAYDIVLKRADGSTVWTRRANGINADLAAPSGASLVGTVAPGVGAIPTTVDSVISRTIYIKDYVAQGDVDASAGIRNARDAAGFGGTLVFESNRQYRLESTVLLNYIGKVIGNNATIKPSASCIAFGGSAVVVGGLISTYSGFPPILTVANSEHFTLPTGTTVAVGDLLQFLSTDVNVPSPTVGVPDYFHGMWATVIAVSGLSATISVPFYAGFNITTIRHYRVPHGAIVENLNFDITNTISTHFTYFEGLRVIGINTEVRGCSFYGNDYAHVGCAIAGDGASVYSCIARDFRNTQGLPLPGRVGYGIALQANNAITKGCTLVNNKHGVTVNERTFVIVNPQIIGNMVSEDIVNGVAHGYAGSIDAHCNVAGKVVIKDNYVVCWSLGMSVRNKKGLVSGNTIIQAGATGMLVNGAEQGFDGLTIADNRIFLFSATSSVAGNYGGETLVLAFKDTLIKDNHIVGGCAFRLGGSNSSASNVKIVGNEGYSNGEFVVATSSGLTLNTLEVAENVLIDAVALAEVVVDSANAINGLKVKGNTVTSVTSSNNQYALNIGSATADSKTTTFNDLDVSGNVIDHSLNTGTLYGIQVSNGIFNRTKVSKNTVVRGASNFRSLRLGRGEFYTLDVVDNQLDTYLVMESGSVATRLEKLKITGNTSQKIVQNEATADFVFVKAIFSENITEQISFDNRAGSTAWASGTEVSVSNNFLYSSADASVFIGTNSTGNKIRIRGNTCGLKPTDASASYSTLPIGNSILSGADQTWKGGTTVDIHGELFSTAAPSTGTWGSSDPKHVINSSPTVGQAKGWFRTVDGTPGTWVAEGNL